MSRLDHASLARRYAQPGPRYTSYPTAAHFVAQTQADYVQHLREAARRVDDPWSVYLHVPFCQQRCDFCACAVVPTKKHDRVAPCYVDSLVAEMDLVLAQIGPRRTMAQLHLGGGTPTYLEPELLDGLYAAVFERFEALPDMESSIEVDPRVTTLEHVDVIAKHGINRLSMGIQDFDPTVQDAIGRNQTAEQTFELARRARARGVMQLNTDLVYGLPGQTVDTITTTIERVVELAPTRVALYGYAHVPWMRPNQRKIDAEALPGAEQRLELFLAARAAFEGAGYTSIGLDHFALPSDPLALAFEDGRMTRNFMGYTVKAGADMLGFGLTAIGDVEGAMFQNEAKLARYHEQIAGGQLPVCRGLVRSEDDRLRGRVIADLMCRGVVSKAAIAEQFGVPFDQHFRAELQALAPLSRDELVVDGAERLELTQRGRVFVRNVAMVFDAYAPGGDKRYSNTV